MLASLRQMHQKGNAVEAESVKRFPTVQARGEEKVERGRRRRL